MLNIIKKIKAFILNFAFCFSLLFKSNKKVIIFLLTTNIVVSICPFINMYIMKSIIDKLASIFSNTFSLDEALRSIIILLCIFTMLKIFLEFLQNYIQKLNELQVQNLLTYINLQLMKKSVQIDISYFDTPKSFDELNQSRQNAHSMHQMVFATTNTISTVFFFITNLILALNVNWWISLLVFLFIIPKYAFQHKMEKKNYEFEKSQFRESRFAGYLYSLLFDKPAAKEIRLFNTGGYLIERFINVQHKLTDEKNKYSNKMSMRNIIVNIPSVVIQILIKIYIVYRVLIRQNTIGDFSYITGIFENLDSSISSIIGSVATYVGYNERINDFKKYFMLRENAIQSGNILLEEINKIEFKNVSFNYPDSNIILNKISFDVNKHEKVMLIGLNGSGKTTLIKLLTRFYEPTEGNILINGINISEYNLKVLREKIATVFQDFNVFSFTIRENVVIGDFNQYDNVQLIQSSLKFPNFNNDSYLALRNIDLYINRNFESEGIELSGGQRQKLAISRAIIRDSKLIILDEPTASLDPLSESEILDAFNILYKDKTLIMVSHRLSAAIKMDKIIFIENGKIIGVGRHNDLYVENEKYKNLFDLQANKYN